MSNILMIPASGAIIFDSQSPNSSVVSPLSAAPRLAYDNAGGLNITSYAAATSALDRLTIDGSTGRLLSVSDTLTGTIFSVNDAAGLPIIQVDSNLIDVVTMGPYNSNTFVISNTAVGVGTSSPNEKLTVAGNISATGDITVSTSARGLILVAPNSTRWRLTITNSGTVSTTAL